MAEAKKFQNLVYHYLKIVAIEHKFQRRQTSDIDLI
jgi:hypothetical protein